MAADSSPIEYCSNDGRNFRHDYISLLLQSVEASDSAHAQDACLDGSIAIDQIMGRIDAWGSNEVYNCLRACMASDDLMSVTIRKGSLISSPAYMEFNGDRTRILSWQSRCMEVDLRRTAALTSS